MIAAGLALVGAPVALIAAGAWALDGYGRRPTPTGRYDAVVVAGCRVYADGRPSAALVRRVRFAADLVAAGAAPRLLLTGGQTGGPWSEAEAARRLCTDYGVTAEVLLEDRSRSTWENAAHAALLLPPDAAILVVTCHYHRWRCERMFRRHFRRVASAGPLAPAAERPRLAVRELASVVLSAALDLQMRIARR